MSRRGWGGCLTCLQGSAECKRTYPPGIGTTCTGMETVRSINCEIMTKGSLMGMKMQKKKKCEMRAERKNAGVEWGMTEILKDERGGGEIISYCKLMGRRMHSGAEV